MIGFFLSFTFLNSINREKIEVPMQALWKTLPSLSDKSSKGDPIFWRMCEPLEIGHLDGLEISFKWIL